MTARKRFKQHVRARAAKTGESYTAALAHARRRPEQERSMSEQHPTTKGPIIVVSGPTGVGKTTVSQALAAGFDPSVHIRTDEFLASVVNGYVDPTTPEAAEQNEVVGGAFASAAMQFADNGYVAIVDGPLFPDGMTGWSRWAAPRQLALHYAVLWADEETCWTRAEARPPGHWPLERGPASELHQRYVDLGLPDRVVIDASGSIDQVTAAVLTAFAAGQLAWP
jgi:predicted kinase